ncbi:triggering receptor expressed on myeloid cells 2-like [Platysternon megacephalum]|uniref:Triggering receptor expressed on myeloid cells 2-like n=1 Tax=Platysternon megacephalum TaxID=55544 RepID=A0A4D9E8Z9_9SAUR|nr:triggering receptor expressed on myeloid cells 2-like [Platysternon megacephalum]
MATELRATASVIQRAGPWSQGNTALRLPESQGNRSHYPPPQALSSLPAPSTTTQQSLLQAVPAQHPPPSSPRLSPVHWSPLGAPITRKPPLLPETCRESVPSIASSWPPEFI